MGTRIVRIERIFADRFRLFDLMYASSLTMFAVGGAILLLASFIIAVYRARRA